MEEYARERVELAWREIIRQSPVTTKSHGDCFTAQAIVRAIRKAKEYKEYDDSDSLSTEHHWRVTFGEIEAREQSQGEEIKRKKDQEIAENTEKHGY